jgi:hypothetical protein
VSADDRDPEHDDQEPEHDDRAPEAGDRAPEADEPPREPRPLIERIGLALVALVLAALFAAVAVAAWAGGEAFLAAMGAIGAAMTLWVGGLTLFRG